MPRTSPQHWIDVQRDEFKRLGVEGDWDNPYPTMGFHAEAHDRRRVHEVRDERLALSRLEAGDVVGGGEDRAGRGRGRISRDHASHTIWVKFPVRNASDWNAGRARRAASAMRSVVIWTTTPWTIPGNRAIAFSQTIAYGLYEVTDAPAENWAQARRAA